MAISMAYQTAAAASQGEVRAVWETRTRARVCVRTPGFSLSFHCSSGNKGKNGALLSKLRLEHLRI